MAIVDLLKGRGSSSQELPTEITEFFLAEAFGWTLHYIRYVMSPKDVHTTVTLLNLYQRFKGGGFKSTSRKEKI